MTYEIFNVLNAFYVFNVLNAFLSERGRKETERLKHFVLCTFIQGFSIHIYLHVFNSLFIYHNLFIKSYILKIFELRITHPQRRSKIRTVPKTKNSKPSLKIYSNQSPPAQTFRLPTLDLSFLLCSSPLA